MAKKEFALDARNKKVMKGDTVLVRHAFPKTAHLSYGVVEKIKIVTTGCIMNRNAVIIFNDEPFTRDNFNQVKTNFRQGERIYYLFATKKDLTSPYIRIQVSTVVDKTATLFYKPYWSGDYRLMKDEVNYYSDYVVIHSRGKFLMQIFKMEDLHHPLAYAYFVVN